MIQEKTECDCAVCRFGIQVEQEVALEKKEHRNVITVHSIEDQEFKWGDEKHHEEPIEEPKEEGEVESNDNEHENND